jgi:hypothetical protein
MLKRQTTNKCLRTSRGRTSEHIRITIIYAIRLRNYDYETTTTKLRLRNYDYETTTTTAYAQARRTNKQLQEASTFEESDIERKETERRRRGHAIDPDSLHWVQDKQEQ